jgi:hypothetical protein
LLSALLAGCATSQHDFVPHTPAEGEAIVYIYRPSLMGNFLISPQLLVNGRAYFKLENGRYRSMRMRAGSYVFGLERDDLYDSSPALTLEVTPGDTRYLRIDTRLEFVPDGMNRRVFSLVEVKPGDAQSEIRSTRPAGGKTTR